MDPNETKQKVLNQDSFHEAKRIRDEKEENKGYRGSADTRMQSEHIRQWAKSRTSWNRNVKRGGYAPNQIPGNRQEFRIVRDDRVNQKANMGVNPDLQNSAKGDDQVILNIPESSPTGNLTDQKHSADRNSDGHIASETLNGQCDSGSGHAKDAESSGSGRPLMPKEKQVILSNSTALGPRGLLNNSQAHSSALGSANSVTGVYSSSLDPVHVPSPDSRSGGRREVGVVGGRRQSSDRTLAHTSNPSSSFLLPLLGKDLSSSTESFGRSATRYKSNDLNQTPVSESVMPSMNLGSASQYNSKLHQHALGLQKATQLNMEWKPKSSRRPSSIKSTDSHQVEVAGLSEKLSQVNNFESLQVIIPHHLRVPESERLGLTFGNFGVRFDSTKDFGSALQPFGNAAKSSDEPSRSILASVPVGPSKDASDSDLADIVDSQARTFEPESPVSAVEPAQSLPENNESLSSGTIESSLSSRDIESYVDIELVESHNPSYSSPEPQQIQNLPSMRSFSTSDPQTKYNMPFLKTAGEDSFRGQGMLSAHEALSFHPASSNPLSSGAVLQQQQQQAVQQLYPQFHISLYPNLMPYRQIISPLYIPSLAMPNYSSNPSYTHASNGSGHLLIPGGSSPHLTTDSGMKYAAPQYKPVHSSATTGYGSYTSPSGYTIGAPGTIGNATGLEDIARIQYKDTNLYIQNPQAETSEVWIQTPRELQSLQSTSYYNLSGLTGAAPPNAAYLQPHMNHPSFSPTTVAAQASHMQYSGLYPPQQAGSITGPHHHHLVQQMVPPGLAAAGGAQLGAYQQTGLSHLGWNANF